MDNKDLIPSFKESIFDNISSLSEEYIELTLDSLLKEGWLKDIPIVGTLFKLGNIAVSIKERHFLVKTVKFIKEMNQSKISAEDIVKHKIYLEENPEVMDKELGYLLILLERHIKSIKSKLLARLYLSYIDSSKTCSWHDFCVLSEILDEISIYDLEALIFLYDNQPVKKLEKISLFQLIRLEKCGVAYRNTENTNSKFTQVNAKLSPQGKYFCEFTNLKKILEEAGGITDDTY